MRAIKANPFDAAVTVAFMLLVTALLLYFSMHAPPKLGARIGQTPASLSGGITGPEHFTATLTMLDGSRLPIRCDQYYECREQLDAP